jgi:hypothetical protein
LIVVPLKPRDKVAVDPLDVEVVDPLEAGVDDWLHALITIAPTRQPTPTLDLVFIFPSPVGAPASARYEADTRPPDPVKLPLRQSAYDIPFSRSRYRERIDQSRGWSGPTGGERPTTLGPASWRSRGGEHLQSRWNPFQTNQSVSATLLPSAVESVRCRMSRFGIDRANSDPGRLWPLSVRTGRHRRPRSPNADSTMSGCRIPFGQVAADTQDGHPHLCHRWDDHVQVASSCAGSHIGHTHLVGSATRIAAGAHRRESRRADTVSAW